MKTPLRGMTLIDVLVGAALFLIIFLALAAVLRTSALLGSVTKAKTSATILLESQMEYLRSLPYDSIGTQTGTPSGILAATATSTVNGTQYTLNTTVTHVDDSHDGSGGGDSNGIQNDYKVVELLVTYESHGIRTESLTGTFVPPDAETTLDGGNIHIYVQGADGSTVSGATVRVVNSTVSPAVDTSTFTSAQGTAFFSGMKSGTGYQVTVSESGYSSAQTTTRSTTNANPSHGHLTVTANTTTTDTFSIAPLSSLTVQTRNADLSPKANVPVVVTGARTLGTSGSGVPVYANIISGTTNAGGSLVLSLPWDSYGIVTTGYSISSSSQPLPYHVFPGASATLNLILTP